MHRTKSTAGFISLFFILSLTTVASSYATPTTRKAPTTRRASAPPQRKLPMSVYMQLAYLGSHNDKLRERSASTLAKMGKRAKTLFPSLRQWLRATSWETRRTVVRLYQKLGPHAQTEATHMAKVLHDPRAEVRAAAIMALVEMGRISHHHIQAIGRLLHDPVSEVRQQVVFGLRRLGASRASAFLPTLAQALAHKDWRVRALATRSYAELGSQAKASLPTLIALLDDKEPAVQLAAAYTLGCVGQSAIPMLRKQMWKNRRRTLHTIHIMGALAQRDDRALSSLRSLLRNSDDLLREQSATQLGLLGTRAYQSVSELLPLLQDPKASVSTIAAWALTQIGSSALYQLRPLLYHPSLEVRRNAVNVIGDFGVQAAQLVGMDLLNKLRDSHWSVRRQAAKTILRIGPGIAKHASPAQIKKTLSHDISTWLTLAEKDKQAQTRRAIGALRQWFTVKSKR